jgi:Protein of unknown function (DUF4007)
MKKGVDAVQKQSTVFARDDAITTLGVGKNMVRSIRHWVTGAEIVEEYEDDSGGRAVNFRPSELGRRLFADEGWDPYLEDPATLWLLHWKIASNARRCTTWFWAFSYVFEPEFTRDTLLSALEQWAMAADWKRVAASSLKRDVDCFLRTYVPSRQSQGEVAEDSLDCPLVELGLIREAGDRHTFQFNRGPQTELPTGVLVHATLDFWGRAAAEQETLSLHDLAHRPGSPGRLFQIDEDSLAARYEEIERLTERAVSYGETAGLKQLYRRRAVDPLKVLERMYAGSHALVGGAARG